MQLSCVNIQMVAFYGDKYAHFTGRFFTFHFGATVYGI